MIKPIVNSQQDRSSGLSRAGGAASRASKPVMQGSKGHAFAAMSNALLKGLKPNEKKLTPGSNRSRSFMTLAEASDKKNLPRSPKAYSIKVNPDAKERDASPREGIAREKRGFARLFAASRKGAK